MIRYYSAKRFLTFTAVVFMTCCFCFGQQKKAPDKYAPRPEEFENIDIEINLSSVKDGVTAALDETAKQFADISKALIASGVDISDIKKLLNSVAEELGEPVPEQKTAPVPAKKEQAAASAKKSSAKKNPEKKASAQQPKKTQAQQPKKTQAQQPKKTQSKQTKKTSSATSNNSAQHTQTIKKVTDMRKQLIQYSLSLRGVPYRTGGTSPENGFDCSGFVMYSVNHGLNKKIPRTANEMYSKLEQKGKIIADSEREPGDLLFFKANPFGNITHVGIYLGKYSGKGRLNGREIFVNSASDGPRTGVVISALDEPYWKRTYFRAGSFLPQSKKVVKTAKARQKKK